MKIGLATCTTIPEVDVDEEITLEAFRLRGHEASLIAWDDPTSDLSEFDAVVVRSTWNYPHHHHSFAAWIQDASAKTKLLNPPEVMLGNLNKRYLTNLAARGIPVVPTQWVRPTDATMLRELLRSKSILKPTIGAGSLDTVIFHEHEVEEAVKWLASQDDGREFMLQPFFESVNSVGEQSIIVIGSELSHRIHKHPRLADGVERVEGPHEVTEEFARLAKQVIRPVEDQILYARVDMMMDDSERWVLSELELIEPSLFFTHKPEALKGFVERAELLLSQ